MFIISYVKVSYNFVFQFVHISFYDWIRGRRGTEFVNDSNFLLYRLFKTEMKGRRWGDK